MLQLIFFFLAAADAGNLQENRYYQLVPVDKSIHKQPEPIPQYRPQPSKHNGADDEKIWFSPYAFSYTADVEDGITSRKESSDDTGRVVGSYHVQDADGRMRKVEYIADAGGFRAKVQTNEPGTKSEDPADVEFKSTAPEPQLGQQARPQYKSQPSYKSDSPKSTPAQPYRPAPQQYKTPSYIPQQQQKPSASPYTPHLDREEPKKYAQQEPKKYVLVPYDGPWS